MAPSSARPRGAFCLRDVAERPILLGFSSIGVDDLSCEKTFNVAVSDAHLQAQMTSCQKEVHRWGAANRVIFDPAKEQFVIIHPSRGVGAEFKFLGAIVDAKLQMVLEIERIRKKTRPKMQAILRTHHLYSNIDLIRQYKTHVLPIFEGSTGVIDHAFESQLQQLDSVQNSFLREIELTPACAFLEYNLQPLNLRRDIAMLGLLFKVRTGLAHPAFNTCFPPAAVPASQTRACRAAHPLQIVDFCDGQHEDLMRRSIFGLVHVFNQMPAHCVEGCVCVSSFQRRLTEAAHAACRAAKPRWAHIWSGMP